jgi:hypothetical protein
VTWEIVPGVGVGPLRFGMARVELHRRLGRYSAFRRGYSSGLTDQFPDHGLLMLTCDAAGLWMVEVAEPEQVTYRGVPLAGPALDVVEHLRAIGVDPQPDEETWTFADGAVALWVPDSDVDGVTVFAPGYYGGELERFAAGTSSSPPQWSHTVVPGQGIGLVSLGESRDAVRANLHGGSCWDLPAGCREPVEDTFWEDGLVVRYEAGERVERIFVTKADSVDFAGVQVMPAIFNVVRNTLREAGHPITDGELVLAIEGTGVELWLANTQTEWELPVSAVVIAVSGGGA